MGRRTIILLSREVPTVVEELGEETHDEPFQGSACISCFVTEKILNRFLGEGMMDKLTVQTLSTIKLAAKKLSGSKRRAFQAQVTKDYLGGSGRRAERVFGWSRTTVEKGLRELETGIMCIDSFSARGRHRT